ncbi:MAG: Histidine ammonia-lyase, partial [Lacunisphaera sp.]|nr:Histidine ammonia-lyase [Lacunisphaera sp.]
MPGTLPLSGRNLPLARLRTALHGDQRLTLTPAARARIRASRRIVDALHDNPEPHYGINTGFGVLANQRVPAADIEQLQENLILSHAVGVGDEVPAEIIRLMLLLKVNGLAVGMSGVTQRVVDYLLRFYNEDALPIVYTKGSLGASGDLAPLAHMVLPLLGLGEMDYQGKRLPAATVLKRLGLKPLRLQSKEGLGLINGTQFMSAYAVHCLLRIDNLAKTADIAAAMTLEAARGSAAPYDARIHAARPHQGQMDVARNLRQLLKGSKIL